MDLLELQKNLWATANGEGIGFVYGKGMKKSELQRLYEAFENRSRGKTHVDERRPYEEVTANNGYCGEKTYGT